MHRILNLTWLVFLLFFILAAILYQHFCPCFQTFEANVQIASFRRAISMNCLISWTCFGILVVVVAPGCTSAKPSSLIRDFGGVHAKICSELRRQGAKAAIEFAGTCRGRNRKWRGSRQRYLVTSNILPSYRFLSSIFYAYGLVKSFFFWMLRHQSQNLYFQHISRSCQRHSIALFNPKGHSSALRA